MKDVNPTPPNELRPWYYQFWFLYPTIVLWPLWPILILRSPWHNGLLSGSLAWAYLISAGYILITKAQLGGTDLGTVIAYAGPGVILTIVTQILWLGDKNKLREQGQQVDSPTLISGAIRSGNSRRRRSKKKRR